MSIGIDSLLLRSATRIASAALLAAILPAGVFAQELVTPEVIGRPDAPITITISPRFAYSHQSNDPKRHDVLADAFEAWVRRHPDVKIQVQVQQGDDAVLVAKRLEDAAAGRAPDAAMTEDIDYKKFYQFAKPFDPYMTKGEIEDFAPGILSAMKDPATGEVKFLQFTSYTSGLWYRRDLVETPPKSLEELKTVAAKLKQDNNFREGVFLLGGLGVTALSLMPQVASLGGELMKDDADSTPVFGEGKNRELLIRVLAYWKSMVDEGLMPSDVVSFAATGDVVSRVASAEMPFALGGTFMGGGIAGTPEGDKWAFTSMPQLDGAASVSFQGGWSWGMFTDDPVKQALVTDLLMDVYVGRSGMARWGEAAGYTPTRLSVLNNYVAFKNDRLPSSYAAAVATSKASPNGRYRSIVEAALTNAFQQVMLGVQEPGAAVDEAWETVKLEMN